MKREDQIAYHWNDLMMLCEAREIYVPEEYERRYNEIIAQINALETV